MNEALVQAITQAFNQRLAGRQLICGMCGGTRWDSGCVINLPAQDTISGGLILSGKSLHLIPLTCAVCGLTQFHNIIKLIGKEKFDEIIAQQQDTQKAVQEAENILKQGGKGIEKG